MNINYLISEKNITKYRLSKETNIPYSTLNDICSGITTLENCNAKTVYQLSKYFNVSMEDLLYSDVDIRYDFEAFKSNVCHELKNLSYKEFIIKTLKEDKISDYFIKKWYPEALYLLAMLDYVSRINNVPICTKYNKYRNTKLNEIIYPTSVIAQANILNDETIKRQALENSIPEFARFNIVENEVFDVV